jgi:hypothetical protein
MAKDQKTKFVLCSRNGRDMKIGSTVRYCGDRCYVYLIAPDGSNIGIERRSDGMSWESVKAEDIGCEWVAVGE